MSNLSVKRKAGWTALKAGLSWKKVLSILLGAMICSFGIHNIHQRTGVTEGGMIGLMLLIEHWLHISPAYITPVLDLSCYLLATKFFGKGFIKLSLITAAFLSFFYKIWELFPPMLPDLSAYPLLAAIAGSLFVGIGTGLIVRQGGSGSGDDALALTISHVTGWRIKYAYLITDLTVLLLSLSYIPLRRIVYSLITVTLSSWIIDWIQNFKKNARSSEDVTPQPE